MVKVATKKPSRTPASARRRADPGAEQMQLAHRARPDAVPVAEVWTRYRAAPSDALRDDLIERFLHLVRYHAERLHTRLPRHVDIDELCSYGIFGLIDAIDAFDPDRNVKFETFAALRISGAILDELREIDWVPRLPRARAAKVEAVRLRFQAETGRQPTRDEILERLRQTEQDADLVLKDSDTVSMRTFAHARPRADDDRETREIDTVRDARQTNPLRAALSKDLRDSFIRSLNPAERLIVILYYQEQMTMKEIGATLDLSESRVSQLHASIMARLRDQASRRSADACA